MTATRIIQTRNKPPMRDTYPLIRKLVALVGCGTVAKACGKEKETVDAWGRPTLSNVHPTGTGKHNPFDCVLRLQRLAHDGGNDALAREIAELFIDDAKTCEGLVHAPKDLLIGRAISEHAEAVVACLNSDDPNFAHAFTEITEAEVALRKLKLWVRDEMANGRTR
jgi:hypothetical protein